MSSKKTLKFDQRKIAALVKKHEGVAEPLSADPIALLIQSALLEDTTRNAADSAMQRIRDRTVDLNEFRISLPSEAQSIFGSRYPDGKRRAIALRRMLYDIFRRNHGMSLSHLVGASKRDVRVALDTMDGATPFVVARVALLAFEVHAMPVDTALHVALVNAGYIDADMDVPTLQSHLERLFKGDAVREAHLSLQVFADSAEPESKSKGKAAKPTKSAEAKRKTSSTKRPSATSGSKR
ncbi:MAG: hypothetical protein O2800_07670 [Planctomycetota bacterium]|nr:hypothetical protein [Planctomycetota bacterium]